MGLPAEGPTYRDDAGHRASRPRWHHGSLSERTRLWLLLGFLALVCLTGGSARASVSSLLLLRPLSVVVLVALLCLPERRAWGELRPLLLLLLAWATVIAIQLVPLPPAIWTLLPGRERYLDAVSLIGALPWHGISLFPDHTWASLLDLLTPAIVLVAYRDLRDAQRTVLLPGLFVVALLCALLGVAQISGGPGSAFYLYDYATQDSPVGFFANRNHESVALVAMLPFLRAWVIAADGAGAVRQRLWIAVMLALLLVAAALVTGSRAGFAALALAIVGAVLVRPSLRGISIRSRWPLLIGGGALLAIAALVALFAATGRLPALNRLMDFTSNAELRFRFLPILVEMTRTFLPFGSGFGSFEPLFRSFEPDDALKFTFFNNAHNDLIETAITGGVAGVVVVLAAITWWVRATWSVFITMPPRSARLCLARAAGWGIGIVLLASLVDYPLRTPLFAAIASLWCCWLASGGDQDGRKTRIAPD